jgi:hypothetical protein
MWMLATITEYIFAFVVFHFLKKQGLQEGRLFALCLGIEYLNQEANLAKHFWKMLVSAQRNPEILFVGDSTHFVKFHPKH